MKYKTIDELNNRIEKEVKKTVNHYYTDWKNYDRPKYMYSVAKGATKFLLIVRDCGTYLFTEKDLDRETVKTIIEYYSIQDQTAKFYRIDREQLTMKKVSFSF